MVRTRGVLTAPWIVAAVAAAALVALVVTYFVALRPDQNEVVGDFSASERAAMRAAGIEAANVLSYRRASFQSDFQRALSGATDPLASDIRQDKTKTLNTMTSGKFDMNATVTHVALEGPVSSGNRRGYVVLVTVSGYRSTAPGVPIPSQLALTVEDVAGKWLVSDIKSIGVSA